MEHTNEFLSRMFAAYAPCGVVEKGKDEIYKMVGVSHDSGNFEVQPYGNSETDWWNIDQFQLSLMPLSSITDEHAIEVAKILGYTSESIGYEGAKEDMIEQINDIITGERLIKWHTFQRLLDYLRPLGYDLGFQHIKSLIEAGLALSTVKS